MISLSKCKRILQVAIFAILLSVLITAVTKHMITADNSNIQNIAGFYQEPNETLDGVYIGSSNCFVFWNSLLAWQNHGISVYPYACNSNLFFSTEYIIKEARKTQPDALFIVNINTLSDGEVDVPQVHNLTDIMPFSWNKLSLIHHLSNIGDYSLSDRLEFYFPLIRFHANWKDDKTDDLFTPLNGFKGASTLNIYLTKSTDVSAAYVTSDEEITLEEKIVSSTESLLNYCDAENLKVLFVTVPQARNNKYDISRFNALNAMIRARGYDVLDLTESLDVIGLDMTKDYYNSEHTNIHGSIKFTDFFSDYLIEHYGLTDKRQNMAYSAWNTAYAQYAEEIAPYVPDIEMDSDGYTPSLKAPTLSLSKATAQVTLSWNRVDGADGYLIYKKAGRKKDWKQIAKTDACTYTDTALKKGKTYYYTVVPFEDDGSTRCYGDFSYKGVSAAF